MSNSAVRTSANRVTPALTGVHGILAGIAGGVVFGLMMQMMDMMPSVAMLVGSHSVGVGWLVHLAISTGLGAAFAMGLSSFVTSYGKSLGYGALYGMVLWVGGALIIMPAKLGMPLLNINTMAWQSLMGHVMFGMVLGAVFVAQQSTVAK